MASNAPETKDFSPLCDQQSYKMTTKGQRPWLGSNRIHMEGGLLEHGAVRITLLSSPEPNNTPSGVCSNEKQIEPGPASVPFHMVLSGNEKGIMVSIGVMRWG